MGRMKSGIDSRGHQTPEIAPVRQGEAKKGLIALVHPRPLEGGGDLGRPLHLVEVIRKPHQGVGRPLQDRSRYRQICDQKGGRAADILDMCVSSCPPGHAYKNRSCFI
jgi:hypothetical protein